eukprot:110311-Rhodomonas_salina.2
MRGSVLAYPATLPLRKSGTELGYGARSSPALVMQGAAMLELGMLHVTCPIPYALAPTPYPLSPSTWHLRPIPYALALST